MYRFDDECEFIAKSGDQIFQETFLKYYELFKSRVKRLSELDKNSLDYKTYFDMALIQLRALCIEGQHHTDNYTLQNYLKKFGLSKEAEVVNEFFLRKIGGQITLKELIKVTTDKFVAHYDAILKKNKEDDDYDYDKFAKNIGIKFLCEHNLSSSESGIELQKIMEFMDGKVNCVNITD